MKEVVSWLAAWMIYAVLFALPAPAQDFTENLLNLYPKPGHPIQILHQSKAFRVTLTHYLDNKEVPLLRLGSGRLYYGLDSLTIVYMPEEKPYKLIPGRLRYASAGTVGGGYRVVIDPRAKFASHLEVEINPSAVADIPIPVSQQSAALKERSKQAIKSTHPSQFPPPVSDKPVSAARMLDIPEADVSLLTVRSKITLKSISHTSLWIVLAGEGSLSLGSKAYPLQRQSFLATPLGTKEVTITPTGTGLRIVLIRHKTS